MRTVRLRVILPILLSTVETILWYLELHSQAWVPSYFGGRVRVARLIISGLDFPATLWTGLTMEIFFRMLTPSDLSNTPQAMQNFLSWLLGVPAQLYFLLSVAGCWYLVGRWLDRRGSAKDPPELKWRGVWRTAWDLLVFAWGLFALLISLHLHKRVLGFFDTFEIAMIQTWAAFLIGVPAGGLVRKLLARTRREPAAGLVGRSRWSISNFRLLEIAVGVFAALLILGELTGPGTLR